MAAAMIKVTVGKAGYGTSHAAYITRLSAIDPQEHEREQEARGQSRTGYTSYISREGALQPTVAQAIEETLDERSLAASADEEREKDVDPIWTWNTPEYVTGDKFWSEEYQEQMRKQEAARPLLARPELVRRDRDGQQEEVRDSESKRESSQRRDESQFVPVSRNAPCPVCKQTSWCSIS